MKTSRLARAAQGAFLLLAATAALQARAAERVGVYDSRLVAYACFMEPENQAALRARMAEGRAAKEHGDTARYEELEKQIAAEQRTLHLQVFSTAPAPDALAKLADRAAAVKREAGVSRLVSKWDDDALRGVPEAGRVDVTDLLVRDCPLSEAQRKTMQEIAAKEPLPLWRAKLLGFFKRL